MRNTQGVKNFIYKWDKKELPDKNVLYDYIPLCKSLLYEDENIVRETIEILKKNITLWSKKLSKVYSNDLPIFDKNNLGDKNNWYVKELLHESANMATSGSTTGLPFAYLRWEPFLYNIEAENHYDLILDEFEIKQSPDILYFFNTSMYDANTPVTVRSDSKNFMEHHGLKRKATTHYVNFKMFIDDKDNFLNLLLSHLVDNDIDVILAPGPAINSLCNYMRKNLISFELCNLLSNTNEKILHEDILFLFENRVKNICDHMRCWDGGASFFTCKDHTYHLMDNLSWCEEIEEKLVSTDYFSLPSPFVRYWNGDYCKIENEYKRCECGRLYREFEFLENRPFSLKGVCFKDIKEKIGSMNIDQIKQVRCGLNTIDVVVSEKISSFLEREISKVSDKFDFRFIVE